MASANWTSPISRKSSCAKVFPPDLAKRNLNIKSSLELGGDEAITLISDGHIRVRISRSTYDQLLELDRRARFSIPSLVLLQQIFGGKKSVSGGAGAGS